jgi:hypothetical protein
VRHFVVDLVLKSSSESKVNEFHRSLHFPVQHALVYQSGYVRPSQVKANPVGMVAMSDNGHCSV